MSDEIEPLKGEVVPLAEHRWRHEVPEEHRSNLDTRLQWLWMQKFGTLQMVYSRTEDLLDRTAATLILQAIMAKDLRSIQQLFTRLEGGPRFDQELVEPDDPAMRI